MRTEGILKWKIKDMNAVPKESLMSIKKFVVRQINVIDS
jgi:hypothetical protein